MNSFWKFNGHGYMVIYYKKYRFCQIGNDGDGIHVHVYNENTQKSRRYLTRDVDLFYKIKKY